MPEGQDMHIKSQLQNGSKRICTALLQNVQRSCLDIQDH